MDPISFNVREGGEGIINVQPSNVQECHTTPMYINKIVIQFCQNSYSSGSSSALASQIIWSKDQPCIEEGVVPGEVAPPTLMY